jgi:hypothetical protein
MRFYNYISFKINIYDIPNQLKDRKAILYMEELAGLSKTLEPDGQEEARGLSPRAY